MHFFMTQARSFLSIYTKPAAIHLNRVQLGSSGALGETLAAGKDALVSEFLPVSSQHDSWSGLECDILNTEKLVVLYDRPVSGVCNAIPFQLTGDTLGSAWGTGLDLTDTGSAGSNSHVRFTHPVLRATARSAM